MDGDEGVASINLKWLFLISPVTVIGVLRYASRQRDRRYVNAKPSLGETPTDVELVGGPWPGKTVVILTVPVIGTALSSAHWGLKSGNANDGHYVVTAVDKSANRVVASWEGTA